MQGKSNLATTIDDYSDLYIQNWTFYFHDLELEPMTLVLKLDLDMIVTYLHTKMRLIGEKILVFLVAMTLSLIP